MNLQVLSWPRANRGAGLAADVADPIPTSSWAGDASASEATQQDNCGNGQEKQQQPHTCDSLGMYRGFRVLWFHANSGSPLLQIPRALAMPGSGNMCDLPLKMLRPSNMESKRRMSLPETCSTFCQISRDYLPVCLTNGAPRKACMGAGYTARWLDGRFASAVRKWVVR